MVALSLDRQDLEEPIVVTLGGWPVGKAASVRNTALGRLDGHAVGLRLSTGTVEQNLDAAVFWDSSRPDEGPRINLRSPIGLELQRRQLLSETTTAFRGGRIRFGAETAAILPASESALQTVLAEVQRDPTLTLLVKAFADARETDGVRLSWKRARAVKDWLVSRGIASDRLEPRGCGSSRALWVGETEEERAANRKAELVRISRWEGCQPPTSYDFR
jgi:outer membrane protein OmpA-like peptidoglycan-associated protein